MHNKCIVSLVRTGAPELTGKSLRQERRFERSMTSRKSALISGATFVALLGISKLMGGAVDYNSWLPLDHPAIQYYQQPVDDAVARLGKKIASGEVKLDYKPGLSYLPSILHYLGINVDSQMLVFSKTSFQAPLISPKTPRALYFNDTTEVGFVQNGDVLEFASLDPKQGVIFYTMDFSKAAKPVFDRRDVCMQCHLGPATLGVPGLQVATVYTSGDGMPAFRAGEHVTNQHTPLSERYGGWYVTGITGSQQHMGNAIAPDPTRPQVLDYSHSQNITSLADRFDTSKYLTGTSDIVALLTLEHQVDMTNLMIRCSWDTRAAQHDGKFDDAAKAKVNAEIEDLVTYMTFANAIKFREPIQGVSTFTKTFPERGPRDKQGRSLRDFDLQTRIFKYPLSYMVYTETFDNMPEYVRDRVYQRLFDILTGKDTSPAYQKLSAEDRKNILEILKDTKPNIPDYFKNANAQPVTASADPGTATVPAR